MENRIQRVNNFIAQEVSQQLSELIETSGILTLKAVETSSDMRTARVWVSIIGESEQDILDRIELKRPEIQYFLNKKMQTKNVPRLKFLIDHSGERATEIDKLLRGEDEESNS